MVTQSCNAPTVKAPILCAMHDTASNDIGVIRARITGARFSWHMPTPVQSPEIKRPIVDMALNASGVRDTARVLQREPHHSH